MSIPRLTLGHGVAKCALPIAYGWLSSSFLFLLLHSGRQGELLVHPNLQNIVTPLDFPPTVLLLDHSLRKVSQAARLVVLRPLRQA